LITGGLGFMGLNLVRALNAAQAQVRILSHSWPLDATGVAHAPEAGDFIKGDIRDEPLVEQAVDGAEVIFHLAGHSGPTSSNLSPLEDLDVNARGELILLEACRRLNPGAKIVFPSSRLVYAPGLALPVAETAPTHPLSMYGIHKLTAENYLLLYHRLYGIRATALRITNPYGPFQRPEQDRYGIINWFIHLAMNGRPLSIYGDGSQLRDYIHIDDVVEAMLLAGASAAADARVMNLGSGSGVSLLQVANLIVETAGRGSVVHAPWPADEARVETGDFVADIRVIEELLGWHPTLSLEAGIEDVVERYEELEPAWR
jgi:UDP-glucose 4-epimerase